MAKRITLVLGADREPEDLLRAAGMHVTTTTEAGLAFLSAPQAQQPDAIVVDLRGGLAVPSVLATITRQHPETGVVLLAATLDPAMLLEAMRAGVNEVVPAPLRQEALEQAIGRVTEQHASAEAGVVIGFVGAKGGVGTTTVAVNMATMLGHLTRPARALLVDLQQSGGDAAVFTGGEPRFSVTDAIENIHRLDQSFLKTLVTGVGPGTDLLASPERPAAHPDSDKARRVIDVAAAAYRFTVVDLPRADGGVLDALDRLRTIYIVGNQELATVKSATRLAAILRQRYGREKVGLVLTRSDRQADIGHADVEKAVGLPVAHTFPSDYRVALKALNQGRPLALDAHSDLSASFRQFATAISGVRSTRETARPTGLLSRLTQRRA
jgi:pilus assembly protein CpaE